MRQRIAADRGHDERQNAGDDRRGEHRAGQLAYVVAGCFLAQQKPSLLLPGNWPRCAILLMRSTGILPVLRLRTWNPRRARAHREQSNSQIDNVNTGQDNRMHSQPRCVQGSKDCRRNDHDDLERRIQRAVIPPMGKVLQPFANGLGDRLFA